MRCNLVNILRFYGCENDDDVLLGCDLRVYKARHTSEHRPLVHTERRFRGVYCLHHQEATLNRR